MKANGPFVQSSKAIVLKLSNQDKIANHALMSRHKRANSHPP